MTLFPATPGVSGANRQSGSEHFPSPFFDYASTAMPTDHQVVLEWCRFIYGSNGPLRTALDRIIAYFLTEVEVGAVDKQKGLGEDEKDKWLDAFRHQWDILGVVQSLDRDRACYGNALVSLMVPFQRLMVCRGRCKGAYPLREVFNNPKFKFSFTNCTFTGHCPRCGWSGAFGVSDQDDTDAANLIIRRWPPQEIVIRHDIGSDQTEYLWDIPTEYRSEVKQGRSLFVLERVRKEVLDAIKNEQLFKFEKDAIYHMREPSISGLSNRGWGISRLLSCFRQVWYVQLLHRFNEAIALDYVIPFRVITPADGHKSGGALDTLNMGNFSSQVRKMLQKRRQDPATWHTLPFPLKYQALGGEASQMAPVDLLQHGWDTLMDAIGVPVELTKGSLQMQAAPMALRWFEATFQHLVTDNNYFLAWFVNRVSEIYSWEKVTATHRKVTHADDMQKHLAVLQMAMGGQISLTSALQMLGLDWKDEQRRIIEEQRYSQQQQAEVQEEMDQAAFGQEISKGVPPSMVGQQGQPGMMPPGGMPPGGDPAAMGGGGQPMMPGMMPPGSIAAQVMGGNSPKSLPDMMAAAEAIANQLLGTPESSRRSELNAIKQQNEALHSLIIQKMDKIRDQAGSQGRQMIMQQNYGV